MAKRKTVEEKIKEKEKWLKNLVKKRGNEFKNKAIARNLD